MKITELCPDILELISHQVMRRRFRFMISYFESMIPEIPPISGEFLGLRQIQTDCGRMAARLRFSHGDFYTVPQCVLLRLKKIP